MKIKELDRIEAEQEAIAQASDEERHVYDFSAADRGIGIAEMESRDKVEQYLKSQPNFAHMNSVGMTERTTREGARLYGGSRLPLKED